MRASKCLSTDLMSFLLSWWFAGHCVFDGFCSGLEVYVIQSLDVAVLESVTTKSPWEANRLFSHAFDGFAYFSFHDVARGVKSITMAGQDPSELLVQKFLDRCSLDVPRILAILPRREQAVTVEAPGKVIAGKKKVIAIEQRGGAAGVARRGDDLDVRRQRPRSVSR